MPVRPKIELVQKIAASAFTAALSDAIAQWRRCRDDQRRSSIEGFRDKQIAHWGTPKAPLPIVNDIFAMSRMTATAMARLANGAGVVTLGLDTQLLNYRGDADRFWRGAAGLRPEK
jgi:hypothetical protein